MNEGRLIFSQITDTVHRQQFDRCVRLHPMPRASRGMSARDQFLAMVFAQITFRESLRDIEACLRGSRHLHAMGVRGEITRTNLAYANLHRDWRVYEALAQILVAKARRLHLGDANGLEIEEMVYVVDSTSIDLCVTLYPWATFKRTNGAVKMHTQMELTGSIPVFVRVTTGSVADVDFLDRIFYEAGCLYVFDRGYLDFRRLRRIALAGAWFVIRPKRNTRFSVAGSRPVDKTTGLRCDQTIRLSSAQGRRDYPERLRRVVYVDPDTGKRLAFLTNHFGLPALAIAKIYKNRWRIELFFKWIKQNLRIKAFYGTSENAVRTQIWIAVSVYLMVAILNKELNTDEKLSRILQVLSVNVFEKVPLCELLMKSAPEESADPNLNQLMLNGF